MSQSCKIYFPFWEPGKRGNIVCEMKVLFTIYNRSAALSVDKVHWQGNWKWFSSHQSFLWGRKMSNSFRKTAKAWNFFIWYIQKNNKELSIHSRKVKKKLFWYWRNCKKHMLYLFFTKLCWIFFCLVLKFSGNLVPLFRFAALLFIFIYLREWAIDF